MKLREFSLPLSQPLETAAGSIDTRNGFLVQLENKPGGIGEATPLAGWTEPLADTKRALKAARDANPSSNPEHVLAELSETPAARHALALALADQHARQTGQPLSHTLSDTTPLNRVPVNATIGDIPQADIVPKARSLVATGYDTLKIKVGARSVPADKQRLAAIRDTIDQPINLRIDANGAWNPPTANQALSAFADLDIEYVEQPLPPADLTGHAALRNGPIPIALDESLTTHPIDRVLAEDAADIVILKPMVLGGIDHAHATAQDAIAAGIEPVITTTIDGVIARTAAGHLAASLPTDRAHGLATADRLARDLGPDPAPITDGTMQIPDRPGHGVREVWD